MTHSGNRAAGRIIRATNVRRQNSLRLPEDALAAFIFVHELGREIIGKGSYLERGATAARVNGVQLDPIKLIIGKDRDEFPGREFGPAHPSRSDRYAESRF